MNTPQTHLLAREMAEKSLQAASICLENTHYTPVDEAAAVIEKYLEQLLADKERLDWIVNHMPDDTWHDFTGKYPNSGIRTAIDNAIANENK